MSSRKTASLRMIQLLSLSLWWGASLFFTFVAAPRIFAFLQHQLPQAPPAGVTGITQEMGQRLAGDTVGGIFPIYFGLQVAAGLLAVLSSVGLALDRQYRARVLCLLTLVSWALVTVHALTVYPHSVRILDEHYRLAETGDASGAAALRRTFGAWHGTSQILNFATILTVTAALVQVGLRPAATDCDAAR